MAFAFYLTVLFFAPLAFGTTETWSRLLAELLVALTALPYFAPLPLRRKAASFFQVPGLLPLLLGLAWCYGQCLPLPLPVVRLLSPNTAALYQPVLELLPSDTWIPLSVNQQATLQEGLRYTAYTLFYVLTIQLLASSRKLFVTITALVWLTLGIALATLLQRAAAPDTLFWLRQLPSGVGSFGPWVYKNHYAGFMVMTCPLLLALFLFYRPRPDSEARSWREQILAFFADSGSSLHLLFGFGAMLVLASVLRAQSRGGVLSLAFALLLFFGLLMRRHGQGKLPLLPLLFFLLTGLLLTSNWFSWTALLARFDALFDPTGALRDDRLLIWRDSLEMVAAFPLTGTGFGTFGEVFPNYKGWDDDLIYDHAHNDYLELLTDSGGLGLLLAACFVGTVVKTGWQQVQLRHDRFAVLTAIGALSGLAGLLFFTLTDFQFHNWANGLYFFFFCGLLISASHTRRHGQHHHTLLRSVEGPARARLLLFLSALLFLWVLWHVHGGSLLAAGAYHKAQVVAGSNQTDQAQKLAQMAELVEQAHTQQPDNGLYLYALGRIRQAQGQEAQAAQLYAEAALQQPLETAYLEAAEALLKKRSPAKH
ncbi:O-antigen ligase family protein [Candidatus Electronema sp. PJ]|uniref:O-antigen ligase family protein n=1 Tax=Candidatus Electronema sp. PJ TaxID=3401572 RepID=UPI003AA7D2F7